MVKVKKIVLRVVAVVAFGSAAIIALPFVPPDSVLCIGSCRKNAQRKFDLLYLYYMEVATNCGGPAASRSILEELSPDLAKEVDEKNASFAQLADREQKGTLTVQEREDYENDPWRIVPYQGSLIYREFLHDSGAAPQLSSVVRSCDRNGFELGQSGYDSYCESYTQLSAIDGSEDRSLGALRSTPAVLVLSEAKGDLFDRLKVAGSLSARMEELVEIVVRDEKAREMAEEEVASSPAATVLAEEVEGAAAAMFYELRCQSWEAQITISND